MPKFPRSIFVRWEQYENDPHPFMIVEAERPGGDDGEKVAIYQLKEIKQKKITEELV